MMVDLSILEWGSDEYFAVRKTFFRLLFNLDKDPIILTQCCDDDPTDPSTCEGGRLARAQKHLDEGTPVVLECFGRRTMDGDDEFSLGIFYKTDMVVVYVPGERIDRELFKKTMEINKNSLFDTKEKLSTKRTQ